MPNHGTRNMYANFHCRCEPCRTASSIYLKNRRSAEIDKFREYGRTMASKLYSENPEKFRSKSRQYRATNPEKIRAYNHHWKTSNRARNTEYERNRRARSAGASGICTLEQLKARVEFYGNRCYVCSGPHEAIDHVKPLARGGSNWPANLRPICRSCNSKKHAKVIRPSELIRILTY